MALTKKDVVDSIYRKLNLPKHRSVEVVESLLAIVKRTLEGGEDVMISGFGKFCVKEKTGRRGRNPQTGGDIMLGERRLVTFKCSRRLRDRINGEG